MREDFLRASRRKRDLWMRRWGLWWQSARAFQVMKDRAGGGERSQGARRELP